jgi:hypothetical protein
MIDRAAPAIPASFHAGVPTSARDDIAPVFLPAIGILAIATRATFGARALRKREARRFTKKKQHTGKLLRVSAGTGNGLDRDGAKVSGSGRLRVGLRRIAAPEPFQSIE